MMTNEHIQQEALAFEDYLIEKRRQVHALAETGGNEWDTRRLIEAELSAEKIPYVELEGTGVVGILDTGRKGTNVALRADIDALPMTEDPNNLKGPRTCISRTPDKTAHMCGHDAHTAMLLTSMKILSKHRDELSGTIYFCFEQGEENNSGWKFMIHELSKYDIDTCWGMHVIPFASGNIAIGSGPLLAGNQFLDFTFVGKGGHGSRPDQAINPVYCGAAWYNNIAVAFANQIDANQTVTLGLTAIKGGQVGNVIPDTAQILGSLRFFDEEEGRKATKIVHDTAEHTAAMMHCTVDWSAFPEAVGVTVNDPELSAAAKEGIGELLGAEHVLPVSRQFGSESFSAYSKIAPSVFAMVGIANPDAGSGAGNHTTHFDVDEKALKTGVMSTLKYVALMEEKHYKKKA